MASNTDMRKRLINSSREELAPAFRAALDERAKDMTPAQAKAMRKQANSEVRRAKELPVTGSRITLAEHFEGTPFEGRQGVVTSTPKWVNELGLGKCVIVQFDAPIIGNRRHYAVQVGHIGVIEVPEVEADEAASEGEATEAVKEEAAA